MLAIASVEAQDYQPIHTIVVDNASSDGSVQAVGEHFPHLPLLANADNLGVSKGRNAGWRYARERFDFQYVIFLDDDAGLKPDFVSKCVSAFEADRTIGVVSGKAFTDVDTNKLMSVGISVNFYTGIVTDIGAGDQDHGQFDEPRDLDACGGFAYTVRADLFEQLGAFDEAFSPYGWEDVDFCLRARKSGYRTRYVPEAVLWHKGTKVGRRPKPEYEQHKIRNFLLLVRRHASVAQKLCCCVSIPAKGVYIIYRMIRTGNARVISAQVRGFLLGLSGRSVSK